MPNIPRGETTEVAPTDSLAVGEHTSENTRIYGIAQGEFNPGNLSNLVYYRVGDDVHFGNPNDSASETDNGWSFEPPPFITVPLDAALTDYQAFDYTDEADENGMANPSATIYDFTVAEAVENPGDPPTQGTGGKFAPIFI